MLLTATSFGLKNPNAMTVGFAMQAISWLAQFAGHGFAEKRSPALFNNLIGGTSLY